MNGMGMNSLGGSMGMMGMGNMGVANGGLSIGLFFVSSSAVVLLIPRSFPICVFFSHR